MKQIDNATVSAHLFYLVLAYLDEANVDRTKPLYQTKYDEFKQLVDDAVKYFISKSE